MLAEPGSTGTQPHATGLLGPSEKVTRSCPALPSTVAAPCPGAAAQLPAQALPTPIEGEPTLLQKALHALSPCSQAPLEPSAMLQPL